jgi:hypothetical protein
MSISMVNDIGQLPPSAEMSNPQYPNGPPTDRAIPAQDTEQYPLLSSLSLKSAFARPLTEQELMLRNCELSDPVPESWSPEMILRSIVRFG